MRRWSVATTSSLALGGACVEQNDAWDGPITRDTDNREFASEASSGTAGLDVASTSTTEGSSTTATFGSSGETTSTGMEEGTTESQDRPPLECNGFWSHVCDEVCTDVKSDPVHCGIGCIDCTKTMGPEATCQLGICQPSDGNDRDEPDGD